MTSNNRGGGGYIDPLDQRKRRSLVVTVQDAVVLVNNRFVPGGHGIPEKEAVAESRKFAQTLHKEVTTPLAYCRPRDVGFVDAEPCVPPEHRDALRLSPLQCEEVLNKLRKL